MLAAAAVLRSRPWFSLRPSDGLLVSAADTPRLSHLGDLGVLAASRGVRAACLAPQLCPRFPSQATVLMPWAPQPPLAAHAARAAADAEACGKGGKGGMGRPATRQTSIFFRGSLQGHTRRTTPPPCTFH